MRAVMFEILNHHSNQDKVIDIYIKENTKVYLEDGTNFIINITNVRIASYSDTRDNSEMMKLIPTKIEQPIRSQKSAFSILKNNESHLTKTIAILYDTL